MITRRNLVRNTALGTAGLALLPFAEHMQAFAAGDENKPPKRFVFFTTASGIDSGYLLPEVAPGKDGNTVQSLGHSTTEVDTIVSKPLAEMQLPWWLKSLEPLVDRTTLITGLSGKMCRGFHTVSYGALGAHPAGDKGKPLGETIDGAFSKLLPGIFTHVGVSANGVKGVSAVGAGSSLPTYSDPIEVYNNLFGVISNDPVAQRRNKFDGKLLDFMVGDVTTFSKRLPSDEREKFGHYLNAYEQMSSRHQQLLAKKDELAKLNPQMPAGELIWEDGVEAHCELIAQAMIAGLTNVAAINTDGNTANNAKYGSRSGFEVPAGGHGFGHSGVDKRVKPFSFNVSMMAKMAEMLKAVPEGDGTMLDNTVLLMVSTSGSTHHTRSTNFPMLMIGNLGGKLRMGQHIQIPGHGQAENRTIGTMYTTLLHAAGFPRNGFGQFDVFTPAINQKQPLAELLT
ncbi:MAG: hypothetical protein ACI9G1_000561 [Pirellulaceae bacterium]|jgi:hypothetical protein